MPTSQRRPAWPAVAGSGAESGERSWGGWVLRSTASVTGSYIILYKRNDTGDFIMNCIGTRCWNKNKVISNLPTILPPLLLTASLLPPLPTPKRTRLVHPRRPRRVPVGQAGRHEAVSAAHVERPSLPGHGLCGGRGQRTRLSEGAARGGSLLGSLFWGRGSEGEEGGPGVCGKDLC